jgi:hypothetical protein
MLGVLLDQGTDAAKAQAELGWRPTRPTLSTSSATPGHFEHSWCNLIRPEARGYSLRDSAVREVLEQRPSVGRLQRCIDLGFGD